MDTIRQREDARSNDRYGDGHGYWHWENNNTNIWQQVLSLMPWLQCMSHNESILSVIENKKMNNQGGWSRQGRQRGSGRGGLSTI